MWQTHSWMKVLTNLQGESPSGGNLKRETMDALWPLIQRIKKLVLTSAATSSGNQYYSVLRGKICVNWKKFVWENLGGRVSSSSSTLDLWTANPNAYPKARVTGIATAFPTWQYLHIVDRYTGQQYILQNMQNMSYYFAKETKRAIAHFGPIS